MAYEYNGDQATFSPDRTPELLMNFSNQFVQRDRERRAQKAALQKQEQERAIELEREFGKILDPTKADETLKGKYDQSMALLHDGVKNKVPEAKLLQDAYAYAANINFADKKIKAGDAAQAANLAAFLKKNPYADAGALALQTKINLRKKEDGKGGYIDKEAEEIDVERNHVEDAAKRLGPNLYSQTAISAAKKDFYDNQKMQDINDPDEYDAKGDRINPGARGKIATELVRLKKDEKGSILYDKNDNAQYEVLSGNYKIPKNKNEYVDGQGQTVKVLEEGLYQNLRYGPLGANADRKTRQALKAANEVMGGQGILFDEDSDYADMLRRKFMLDELQDDLKDRYIINPQENKSVDLKMKLRNEQRQQEQLRLAKEDNYLARQKFEFDKRKENGEKPTVNDVVPLTESYKGKATPTLSGRLFINANDIDAEDEATITGAKFSPSTNKLEGGVKKVKLTRNGKDEEGYYILEDGNWEGKDGKVINAKRVRDAQYKYYNGDDLPKSSKGDRGIISRITNLFTTKGGAPIIKP